eukprot:g3752.t1
MRVVPRSFLRRKLWRNVNVNTTYRSFVSSSHFLPKGRDGKSDHRGTDQGRVNGYEHPDTEKEDELKFDYDKDLCATPEEGEFVNGILKIDKETLQLMDDQFENGMCVIYDVRSPEEINETGFLVNNAVNLQMQHIQRNCFAMDPEDFEDLTGGLAGPLPEPDKMLVFYCKAGVRSRAAAEFAIAAGYEDVAEYPGGANEFLAWVNDQK